MKVLVACDSYKGCLQSEKVNTIIKSAILAVNPHIAVDTFMIGDGGEGTMAAFYSACGGTYVSRMVKDAYFKDCEVQYVLIEGGSTAVIEVASCIGLTSYPREQRHPLYATSYGVGQLLLDAQSRGVRKIIIGLGGSATNDGGMGMLQALGAKFYDEDHNFLKSNAKNLKVIHKIDLSTLNWLEGMEIVVACDVQNKLLGKEGATYIFGKQKGLFANQLKRVESGMENYANLLLQQGYEITQQPGSGAAGGIGAALTLFNGQFISGLTLLRKYSNLDNLIANCDLVVTGEGQSDKQTLLGKVPAGIVSIANHHKKPCICISGALGSDYMKLYELGFIGIFSVADRVMTFDQALALAEEKLYNCTYSIFKLILNIKEENN